MSAIFAACSRELQAMLLSPLAYVMGAIFALGSGILTWNVSRFFDTARAELDPLFFWQPWLLALIVPALAMRSWSEDIRSHVIDLYLTSPSSIWQVTLGKLLALCVIVLGFVALLLPYWWAVSYLGDPDHGQILSGLWSVFSLGLVFAAITLAVSATTSQQVVVFVISSAICIFLLVSGLPAVTGALSTSVPAPIVWAMQNLSLLDMVSRGASGLMLLSDGAFAALLIALALTMATSRIHARRSIGSDSGQKWIAIGFVAMLIALPFTKFVLDKAIPLKADLTEYKVHSLSRPAATVLSNLKEPVDLQFFYTASVASDYPDIRAHARRVGQLLMAMEQAANGKLRISRFDPSPFSADEDIAIARGIEAVPSEGVDPLYFGLSLSNVVDDRLVIPFLSPDRDATLEFDLIDSIARLDQLDRPKLAILSGHPAISETATNPSAVQLALESAYQIEWIKPDQIGYPLESDAVLIVQPEALTPWAEYLVEQAVLETERAIVLIDPSPLFGGERLDEDTREWLERLFGMSLSSTALTDPQNALQVSVQGPDGPRAENQPLFIALAPANQSASDLAVRTLTQPVQFGAPGWIEPREGLGATLVLKSSASSATLSNKSLANAVTPADVRRASEPLGEGRALAMRVSGVTQSTLDRPVPTLPEDPVLSVLAEAELSETPAPDINEAAVEAFIVSDTDFLLDAFHVDPQTGQSVAGNSAFVLALVDHFARAPELAQLRARTPTRRPMTRIDTLRREAESEYLDRRDSLEQELASLSSRQTAEGLSEQDTLAFQTARAELRELQQTFRASLNSLEGQLRWITFMGPVLLLIVLSILIPLWGRRT